MTFRGRQCFYNPFTATSNFEDQKAQKYKGIMFNAGWRLFPSTELKSGVIIGNDNDTFVKSNNDKYRLVKHYAGIEYKNECITVDFWVEKKNFKGGDLKPETIFRFVVHLKSLGG
ncbi:MAG: hypothetical protein LBJ71_03305, partial [Holosporaceae bacterium]|jgi:hypothetical protein|nr:hypothetical protein [Holosporaceae bacterium]